VTTEAIGSELLPSSSQLAAHYNVAEKKLQYAIDKASEDLHRIWHEASNTGSGDFSAVSQIAVPTQPQYSPLQQQKAPRPALPLAKTTPISPLFPVCAPLFYFAFFKKNITILILLFAFSNCAISSQNLLQPNPSSTQSHLCLLGWAKSSFHSVSPRVLVMLLRETKLDLWSELMSCGISSTRSRTKTRFQRHPNQWYRNCKHFARKTTFGCKFQLNSKSR
jgi:hypothetical protein